MILNSWYHGVYRQIYALGRTASDWCMCCVICVWDGKFPELVGTRIHVCCDVSLESLQTRVGELTARDLLGRRKRLEGVVYYTRYIHTCESQAFLTPTRSCITASYWYVIDTFFFFFSTHALFPLKKSKALPIPSVALWLPALSRFSCVIRLRRGPEK